MKRKMVLVVLFSVSAWKAAAASDPIFAWRGTATIEESVDGLIEITPGSTFGATSWAWSLGLSDDEIEARMNAETWTPFEATGQVTVRYDRRSAAWFVRIETGEDVTAWIFPHVASDNPAIEAEHPAMVHAVFDYLSSPPVPLPPLLPNVVMDCPKDRKCCKAATCEAVCDANEGAVCRTYANGTCSARCVKMAV